MDQASLWTRRANTKDKPFLSTRETDTREGSAKLDSPRNASGRRFGDTSTQSKNNPFNTASPTSLKSPGVGSSTFGFGTGAFASFGSAKAPKTPSSGSGFDFASRDKDRKEKDKEVEEPAKVVPEQIAKAAPERLPSSETDHELKNTWNLYYRPPAKSRDEDYEKSIIKVASIDTVEGFWTVYSYLNKPSQLPTVSDYHIFKDGIRPAWEDEANKQGGKWILRLKKGVADRYWEDLLLAMLGDQFMEASDEVCGAVLSVRSGEDVLSVWTKNDGGRNVKIRETIKRILSLPADTNTAWRSHDESIAQKSAVVEARAQKTTNAPEKRRTLTLNSNDRPAENKPST